MIDMRLTTKIRSECPITGIIVKHLRTTPKVTTFLPPNQIHLLKKGAVMFVLAALACGGLRSEQLQKSVVNSVNSQNQHSTQFVTGSEVTPRMDGTALVSTNSPVRLDWLLGPKAQRSGDLYHATIAEIYDRVLSRLIQAEAHEVDLHLRSDYRQAFICVSLARKGNTEPFLAASYTMYGVAPDKVWPAILRNRQAKLGREYSDWFDQSGLLKPDVPKKPTTGDAATGDGTSSELPGSTSPASLKKEAV